jgi:hypothetical protein
VCAPDIEESTMYVSSKSRAPFFWASKTGRREMQVRCL